MNLTDLTPYLPYWDYYKTNSCLPPVPLADLQAIETIYRREMHPAPVRLYCGVCVADMFTSVFGEYERQLNIINQSLNNSIPIHHENKKRNDKPKTKKANRTNSVRINRRKKENLKAKK